MPRNHSTPPRLTVYRWTISRATCYAVGLGSEVLAAAGLRLAGLAWSDAVLAAALAVTPVMILVDRIAHFVDRRSKFAMPESTC